MPTPHLEEPITKVTLNIFTKDLEDLRRWEGTWGAKIRDIIRQYCNERRRKAIEGKLHERD